MIGTRQGDRAVTDAVHELWQGHGSRFVCYAVVGGSGVFVNTAVLYLLVRGLGWNHLAAAAISSEVSILSNFVLNDLWTFRDRRSSASWLGRAGQYNAVALGGMLISLSVLAGLTVGLGMHYLIANLGAIGVATFSNYLLNHSFTWKVTGEPVPVTIEL